MTKGIKILNIIYVLIVVLFLIDGLTSFDIKSQGIKTFVHFGLLIGTPIVLFLNLIINKTPKAKIIWASIPTIVIILILILGPMKIIFSSGAWRTQTVLYQNGNLSNKFIEFQMQDIGSRGYKDRVVEVFYLTPFFTITNQIPSNIDKEVEWIRVDREVNELGIKFP